MMGQVRFVQASSMALPLAVSGARSARARCGVRRRRRAKRGWRGGCMVVIEWMGGWVVCLVEGKGRILMVSGF